MKKVRKRLFITTGDPDGIGLEVTLKALLPLPKSKDLQIVLFHSETKKNPLLIRFRNKKKSVVIRKKSKNSEASLLKALKSDSFIIEYIQNTPAPLWVEQAAKLCLEYSYSALVTGPLSKPLIKSSGLNDIGHTEILKRICVAKNVFMGFIGHKFSVVLATDHCPLSEVPRRLTEETLREALLEASHLASSLSSENKPIGLLGLNPHAGDQGLIGSTEDILHRRVIADLQDKVSVVGPLVPDAAFVESNWKKYSVYVANYHDQGLIPFKTVHGFDSGVHVSLGLPIIRTSVDHGTAKDIYGKNKAQYGSMKEAILLAIKLIDKKINRRIHE